MKINTLIFWLATMICAPAFAQMACTTNPDGSTSCTGTYSLPSNGGNMGAFTPPSSGVTQGGGISSEAAAAKKAALEKVCNDVKSALNTDVTQCKSQVTYITSNAYAQYCSTGMLYGTYTFSMNYSSGTYLKLDLSLPPQQFTYGSCLAVINAAATFAKGECQVKADRIAQSACSQVN